MLLALTFTGITCFFLGKHYSKTYYKQHYKMHSHFEIEWMTRENRRIIAMLEYDKSRLLRDIRLMRGDN